MGGWWQRFRKHPTRLLLFGFAATILAGGILLTLPCCAAHEPIKFLDALFTATSAVCVTGLTVRDTATEFSTLGHVVILVLIQLGGLGITTLSTALFLLFGQRASLSTSDVVESSFRVRPEGKLGGLLAQVFVWTITIELAGAAILVIGELHRLPSKQAAWTSLFHAVSAFCNAGFALRSDSLISEQSNPAIILPIACLIILGGLGFNVLAELGQLIRNTFSVRSVKKLSLHAKTALVATVALLIVGTIGYWGFERTNVLQGMTPKSQFLVSFFASVTARTAGFNSIDYGQTTAATVFMTIVLMAIGGCPGSTAGGMKATTIAVLLAAAYSKLKASRHVNMFGRGISDMAVNKALAVVAVMTVLIIVGTLVLSGVDIQHVAHAQTSGRAVGILFEVVSALGTVGLTTGITPTLTSLGKVIVIILMFVGRLGPLTIAIAISQQRPRPSVRLAVEPVMVG